MKRPVSDSARAAARDLFAYRRSAFERAESAERAYGIGIAWGAELEPAGNDELVLCTPDRIQHALDVTEPTALVG